MKKLERNLIDNILESEVKLGCASTPVTFYYPESSLNVRAGILCEVLL